MCFNGVLFLNSFSIAHVSLSGIRCSEGSKVRGNSAGKADGGSLVGFQPGPTRHLARHGFFFVCNELLLWVKYTVLRHNALVTSVAWVQKNRIQKIPENGSKLRSDK